MCPPVLSCCLNVVVVVNCFLNISSYHKGKGSEDLYTISCVIIAAAFFELAVLQFIIGVLTIWKQSEQLIATFRVLSGIFAAGLSILACAAEALEEEDLIHPNSEA